MKTLPLRVTVFVPGDLDRAMVHLHRTIDRCDKALGGAGVRTAGFAGRDRKVRVSYLPIGRRTTWPARARVLAAAFRELAHGGPLGSDP